jgi:hypothetical protein
VNRSKRRNDAFFTDILQKEEGRCGHAVGGLCDKERKIELEVVGRAVVYVTTSNAR